MTAPAEIVPGEDGGVTMVWRRHFPDPVDDVWAAITEPERLGRWIGTWTSETGEPRVGGTVAFTMTGELDAGATECTPFDVTITVCEAPHRLAVIFPGDTPETTWHVDLTVEPHDDGSVLVFAQRFADGQERGDIDAGWRWYLDRLDASLRATPMPPWSAYAP